MTDNQTLGFGMKCVKYFLFLLNFVFLVIGIFTVTIGAIILLNYDNFDLFLESYHLKPAQLIIAVGALTIATCFIGCLGAFKESTLIVNTYALLLFISLLLEIALIIVALIFRCDIYDNVGANMKRGMESYNRNPNIKEAWDITQEVLHCCGVNNPYEWARYNVIGHLIYHNNHQYTVPYSCCNDTACNEAYTTGCLNILSNYISESMTMFVYVSLGNAIVKIFAIILARMLAKAIRGLKSEREMQRQLDMHRELEQAMGTSDTLRESFSRFYTDNINRR